MRSGPARSEQRSARRYGIRPVAAVLAAARIRGAAAATPGTNPKPGNHYRFAPASGLSETRTSALRWSTFQERGRATHIVRIHPWWLTLGDRPGWQLQWLRVRAGR